MAVKFRIDQNSRPQGVVDETRHDLVPLQLITLTAIDPPPGPGVTYQWEIIDRAGTDAGLSATTGDVVTITPPSGRPWGFCVELRAYLAGVLIGARRRILSARGARFNLRLPLFSETADPVSKLAARNPEASTDNAVCNLGGTLETGQNWRGWAQLLHELVMAVEGLVYGVASSGTPSRVGNASGSMGSDQLAAPANHVHPNPQLSLVPTPSRLGFASVKTSGSELFALADHEHAGAAFSVFPILQNGGTFIYTIGDSLAGSSDVKQMFLDFDMTLGTSVTIKVPVGDETYVPRGTRIWGAQAGDAPIQFEALTNVQIEAPDGVTATAGKGCLFLLVKIGVTGFNPVKWRLMIFPGTGGSGSGGGAEVTAAAVRQALAGNDQPVFFNSQRLSAVGVAQSDGDAMSRGYMRSYLGALPFAANSDLSGYIVDSNVQVVRLRGRYIATTAPSDGQALVWNATDTQWEPATLAGGGGALPPIPWPSELEGTYPNITLKTIVGRELEPTGSMSSGFVLTLNGDLKWQALPPPSLVSGDIGAGVSGLRVEGIWERPIASTAPANGAVLIWDSVDGRWEPGWPTGDIDGAMKDVQVVGLRGVLVDYATPTAGQALVFDGTWWTPTTLSGGGGPVTLAGDVTGASGATVVGKLQGRPVAATAPTSGQVLGWDGATWKPTTPSGGGGAGTLDGDVVGDAGTNTVVALRNSPLATYFSPFDGEYLMFDGLAGGWTPSALAILGYRISGDPPMDGQVLTFVASEDESPSFWRAVDAGGGGGGDSDAVSLQGYPVRNEAPSEGDVLTWDGEFEAWRPLAGGGGGGDATSIQGVPIASGEGPPLEGSHLVYRSPEVGEPYWQAEDVRAARLRDHYITLDAPADGDTLIWSEDDSMFVYGPAGGSALATGWQIGLDLNLTQEANFTFVDGSNSWNGKAWTGEGIAAKTDSFGVINGTGLVLDHNAQNTAWAMSSDTAPKIWISLASLLPDFVWGQHELRVTADFEVSGVASYDLAGIAIEKAFVSNQCWTHKLYAGNVPGYQRYGQVLMEGAEAGGYLFPTSEKVNRLYIRNPTHVQYLSRASAAASPTDLNSIAFGADGGFSVYGVYAAAYTGAPRIKNASEARLVIAAQTGNTGNACVLTIRRLRVEYKV